MKRYFILAFILNSFALNSQTIPAPFRLRTDLLLNTNRVTKNGSQTKETLLSVKNQQVNFQFAKIYQQAPSFHWETVSSIKNVSAWRIILASSLKNLEQDKGDYWDSKKTIGAYNRAVYSGKSLHSGDVYFWKVQVWDQNQQPSSFSLPQSFYLAENDSTNRISHFPLSTDIQYPVEMVKKNADTYFIDFGKDAFATLQLHLTSPKKDSIWIEVGEGLASPQVLLTKGGTIRYKKIGILINQGTHDYNITWPLDEKRNLRNPILMPDYIGEVFPFRYLTIENFSGRLEKNSVQRKMVYYPFNENAASFTSSDTILNKVWDLCKYSIKATSFSGFYVDGDRERVPYEADALINQLSHYAVDAEYSMARRSMQYLIYHPTWPTEWSLQNVLLAWNDYLYTGDTFFLKQYYTELQKKTLMPLAEKNGLISTLKNKQTTDFLQSIHITKAFDGKQDLKDIVDWPKVGPYIGTEKEYPGETDGFIFNTYNSVVNAFYYRNLVLMQKIAFVLNQIEDAELYEQKANEVFNAYQKVFREEKTALIKDGDSTLHTSLHSNMFALAFGLIPKEDIKKVTQYIKSRKMACSVYGSQFLLDALYDSEEDEYALSLLTSMEQRSWYNMIRVGSTISMEAWDILYKPNLDLNHAWGAAPANIIVRKLMGIEPLTPGASILQIKPQTGNLQYASLQTTTIRGRVAVTFDKKAKSNFYAIEIPGAVSANVLLEYDQQKPTIYMDGKKMNVLPQSGFFVFDRVPAGKHQWVMK